MSNHPQQIADVSSQVDIYVQQGHSNRQITLYPPVPWVCLV